jgi:hypothetical protein
MGETSVVITAIGWDKACLKVNDYIPAASTNTPNVDLRFYVCQVKGSAGREYPIQEQKQGWSDVEVSEPTRWDFSAR